jgi:hypothetical protein
MSLEKLEVFMYIIFTAIVTVSVMRVLQGDGCWIWPIFNANVYLTTWINLELQRRKTECVEY